MVPLYGNPLGAEAATHAARIYLQNLRPGCLMLKLDFKNAFNCLRRDTMLIAVKEMASELLPLVHSAYCNPSSLLIGNETIQSAEGVQQGDPLGQLLICLTIHRIVQQLRSEVRMFYLDDGTLGGCLDDVLHDLQTFELAAGKMGLQLNRGKSEVICEDPIAREACFLLPLACGWSVETMPPSWVLPQAVWRALTGSFVRRPRFCRSWGIDFDISTHMMPTVFFTTRSPSPRCFTPCAPHRVSSLPD